MPKTNIPGRLWQQISKFIHLLSWREKYLRLVDESIFTGERVQILLTEDTYKIDFSILRDGFEIGYVMESDLEYPVKLHVTQWFTLGAGARDRKSGSVAAL